MLKKEHFKVNILPGPFFLGVKPANDQQKQERGALSTEAP
jgi:hypothetical protein